MKIALNKAVGTNVAVACILAAHAFVVGMGLPRNSVTIDEVYHLPAGISYWHFGQFWCYHQNPPLVKLAISLPAVLGRVPTDYQHFNPAGDSRGAETGRDFMMLNRHDYMGIYVKARLVVIAISVLGGYLVFRWSNEMFGALGGLISVTCWATCPEILAHAGLATVDMGATVVALAACYRFRVYLTRPSWEEAVICGALLGIAEASKFSLVVLPVAWFALVGIKVWSSRLGEVGERLRAKALVTHAAIVICTSLYVLNSLYLFEGTGERLGDFEFHSRLLTGREPSDRPNWHPPPGNRFLNSFLAPLPMPVPRHYLLGFDDQMADIDGGNYYKYLRGELTRGDGWYWYYLYYLAVKTPVGMLALMLLAAWAAFAQRLSWSSG